MKNLNPSRPLLLPEINLDEAINRSVARFTNMRQQIGNVDATPNAITISLNNAEYAIKHPDELIEDVTRALEFSIKMRDRVPDNRMRFTGEQAYQYFLWNGVLKPTTLAPWDLVEDTESQYITLVQCALPTYEHTGVTHFVTLSEHKRLLAQAQLNIETIVAKQVERGVSTGVAKAIEESTATLSQVQREKQSVSQQIAALQKEKQRLEQIENRLQERDRIEAERRAAKEATKGQRTTAGYVYLLKETNGTHFKIGRTSNPDNRLQTFSVKLPFQVEYKHLIQTDDMYKLESELHIRYASKRIDGEWFALSEDDVLEIISM